MTDTPPEIQKILDERFQALTLTERVIMASQMFDSARQIILASFPPDLSEIEVKRRCCDWFSFQSNGCIETRPSEKR